jgi:hypothetical protein
VDTFWGPDFTELEGADPEIAAVVLGELTRLRGMILCRPELAEEVATLVGKFPAYPR